MADNIDVSPGVGKTIAADDIGGILHQRVKIVIGADGVSSGDIAAGNPMPISGPVTVSNFPATQAISAAALPLPAGASTAAKQPALGTAGTASADVITVQGIASMTPIKTDGSGVTQPVSGTFWQTTQPVSASALPLPAGASTESTLSTMSGKIPSGLTVESNKLKTRTYFGEGTLDSFGSMNVGSRNNQIETDFSSGTVSSKLSITSSGGGGASIANGQATFSTGTASVAQIKGVTNNTIKYDPGHEIYAEFTASFTAPTHANSYQRIGPYDTNNGFFIGYEGTTFKITRRSNSSDTSVAKGAWSEDNLTGAVGSKFTRAGTPEAVDFTKINIFRIRFGWLGVAPILFDIMSPDGEWVTFHKILYPNSQTVVSVESTELPITVDIAKLTADATNLVINSGCWAAGTCALATTRRLGFGLSHTDTGQIVYAVPSDGVKDTYSASINGLALAASATDYFTISGSATKVVKVNKIVVSMTQTATAINEAILLKRSTANTGGSSSTLTSVPHDSANSSATATVLAYTANPTVGTLVGQIRAKKFYSSEPVSANNNRYGNGNYVEFDFGNRPGQAITLRGAAQSLCLNFNGASAAGSSVDVFIEWTEEDYQY